MTGALNGLCVLIVEDEMLLAMNYEMTLQDEGCSVLGPVGRVAQAMELLQEKRPDVALVDLNLQGERPVALAEALLAAGVPFIVATGYGERAIEEPVLRAAPRLNKPLRSNDLITAIREAIRTR